MISFLNNHMDYASILLEIQEESNAFPIKGMWQQLYLN
jgi:hypothetical protein